MRAEPKTLTEGWICARRSKPATNSDMIWKIFHDSRDISPEDAVVPRASGKANGISGGAEAESFIFQA